MLVEKEVFKAKRVNLQHSRELFIQYNMELEVWKDVKEYEGLYQISNLGNVRSVSRIVNNAPKGICRPRKIKDRKMKAENKEKGYKRISLFNNWEFKRFYVHRLVAIHFIPNPQNKPCINHIDRNPSNNKASNLEWVTYSENNIEAWKTKKKLQTI